jgi:hypothetical protein
MPDIGTATEAELANASYGAMAKDMQHETLPRTTRPGGLWYNPIMAVILQDVELLGSSVIIQGEVVNGGWRYRYIGGAVHVFDDERRCRNWTPVSKEVAAAWHRVPDEVLVGVSPPPLFYSEVMSRMNARLTTQAG